MAKRLMKYNPAFLTQSELVRSFVVRTTDLKLIVDVIRDNSTTASNQHILLVGPRGIGKTTLVLRVAAEVGADGYLRDNWYPLVFGEEAYEVSTPGEFWLEALFHLARQTGESMWQDTYLDLRRETDESRLRERALAQLMDFADQQKKRILLVVENLHMLLGDQISDDDAWVIRHTLVNEPRLMLLATAANRFHSIQNSNQAMFELFKIHELEPLSNDDSRTLWEAVTGEELVGDRIRPIRILTGGNPRLLTIIAGFAMRSSFRELTTDLVDLVDDHTDYFKSHLDYLPPQERKVFVALADIWDPATASEVAATARIPVNKVSAHLSRLVNNGAVIVVDQSKGKKWYQLAERMYNIYHLMRRRGNPSARVEAIIQFMVHFYEAGDLAKRIAEEAVTLPSELREEHFQAYRAILEHARSLSDRCRILEATPQPFLESPDMPASVREVIEASKVGEGIASDAEAQMLPSERNIRERLSRASADPQELVKIGQELGAIPGGSSYAEEAYRIAADVAPDWGIPWLSIGCLLHPNPDRYEEAEQAYRKAIELGPANAPLWVLLGWLYLERNRHVEAENACRRAIEIAADSWLAWFGLGILHVERGSYSDAEQALRAAINAQPSHSPSWALLGSIYRLQSRYSEGEQAYLKATEVDPANDWAWGELGHLYAQQERWREAQNAYLRSVQIDSGSAFIWQAIGRTYHQQGKLDEAEDAYRKAIEYGPERLASWIGLIRVLAADPRRGDEVVETANGLLEQTGRSAESLDMIARGLAMYWPAYAEYALACAKAAVEQEPDQPRFALTLAFLLAAQGDNEGALDMATLVIADCTLVDQRSTAVIGLFETMAARGRGTEALRLLQGSASEQALEPLICGIRMFLGEKVNVAQEIKEIAEDIVASIRKLQEENEGQHE